mmetsp:Transcript_11634/g.22300  ORF Transcript_11634/g.22300 Transcript_11634/m.22300 type:complete len:159 (-) Transcript_11634:138-614(-)
MSTLTLFARNIARQSLNKAVRLNTAAAQVGAVRFSSYFTPAHEYIKVDGKIGTCGITDFAQAALGDIVFVDLPEVGDEFDKGDSFGSVESVKAASDVYAPVSGTVVEVNDQLGDEPGMVNEHAEGDAWFIKIEIKDDSDLDDLLKPDAYKEHCENEAH